ncbi:MAG: hypothetical protein HQK60_15745 [Deltaproteobacteria bacterium]|nr:hypothetical protein [Deltaproteobacteria bacterium]
MQTKEELRFSIAAKLMNEFAGQTGIASAGGVQRRYLWTDAFAVCNFLGLYRQTNDESYKNLALLLVDQVHRILGRHRPDGRRAGWISGLDEQEGEQHPVIGGLRIGKIMDERRPDDPFNEQLEWDRDGQYYHYLTKWMHALNRVTTVTGDPTYNRWAIELAKTAHAKFTYVPRPGGQRRMYWKMSIDLSYPLVAAMGHHDPLDGLITYHELQAGAMGDGDASLDLTTEIDDMVAVCHGKDWATDDLLGLGGLLSDGYRAAQMIAAGALPQADLLTALLDASLRGLEARTWANSLLAPADYRLAFRELGLSIGLHALDRMRRLIETTPDNFQSGQRLSRQIEILMQYEPLVEVIENFWLEPANRQVSSFTEHGDINMVMLATSLAPDGYLMLQIHPKDGDAA